ncbi:MAG: phosphatidate cytidylyltransferase [Verrucomicrobia bacterium]|nr:phosphatidate cytidylyltransferase [Verrucomicrobiota bacterium]
MENDARPTKRPKNRAGIFAQRLASSATLWGVLILALFAPTPWLSHLCFLAAVSVLALLGLGEFYEIARRRGLPCFPKLGLGGGLLLIVSTWLYLSGVIREQSLPAKANDFETGFLILFVLGLCLRRLFSREPEQGGIVAVSVTLLGLMYAAWLLNFVQKIAFFPRADGKWYLIFFLVATKFSDMGAYLVGSLIGRHKMSPRISPGKTWEGFGGALLFSVGAALTLAHLAGSRLTGMTPLHALILGVILGTAAVAGDLIESQFKREAGLKDSGRLLPGIGGILDLLDSILFNAPLMYLYLRHILTD